MKKLLIGSALALVLGLVFVGLPDAAVSTFTSHIKYIFKNGISVTGGTSTFSGGSVSFSGATVTGITFSGTSLSGDLTLENSEFIDNSTNGQVTLGRNDAGVVTVSCADNDATAGCTYDAGGASPIVVGSADVTSITATSDGGSIVLDGTVALPNAESIANSTDGSFTLARNDAGVVTIVAADNDATAALTVQPGGAAAMTLGGASMTALTVTSDGTGNAEVVLPAASVGAAEVGHATLRVAYCGQNDENNVIYQGAVGITAAEPVLADATCDALDNGTEGTADVVLSAGLSLTAKYMRCTTAATLAAGETITAQLRDDTADVTGVTCQIAEAQTECEVLVPTASAIAAASATAMKVTQVSNNADDDLKCVVLYQVQ